MSATLKWSENGGRVWFESHFRVWRNFWRISVFSPNIHCSQCSNDPIGSLPCSSIMWCDTFKILTEQIIIRYVFNVQIKATCYLNMLGEHTVVSSPNVSCCHVIGWLASCVNKQPNNSPKEREWWRCVQNQFFPSSLLFPQENVRLYNRLPINSSAHEAPSSRTTELLSALTDNMHLLFIHNSKRQWSGFARKLAFA